MEWMSKRSAEFDHPKLGNINELLRLFQSWFLNLLLF